MNLAKLKQLGTLSLINFGRKHREKLAQHSNAAIQGRAPVVGAACDGLEQTYAARRPLTSVWKSATAAKDAADDGLDSEVSALSYELLSPALLKKDRAHPDYRALFPEGNIGFINGPDRAELVQVRAMVNYLRAHPAHPMANRAPGLETKCELLSATLDPQAAAEQTLRAAESLEAAKRSELQRTLRKSAIFLRDQLDGDEQAVEALFPSLAEAKVKGDPDRSDDGDV